MFRLPFAQSRTITRLATFAPPRSQYHQPFGHIPTFLARSFVRSAHILYIAGPHPKVRTASPSPHCPPRPAGVRPGPAGPDVRSRRGRPQARDLGRGAGASLPPRARPAPARARSGPAGRSVARPAPGLAFTRAASSPPSSPPPPAPSGAARPPATATAARRDGRRGGRRAGELQ